MWDALLPCEEGLYGWESEICLLGLPLSWREGSAAAAAAALPLPLPVPPSSCGVCVRGTWGGMRQSDRVLRRARGRRGVRARLDTYRGVWSGGGLALALAGLTLRLCVRVWRGVVGGMRHLDSALRWARARGGKGECCWTHTRGGGALAALALPLPVGEGGREGMALRGLPVLAHRCVCRPAKLTAPGTPRPVTTLAWHRGGGNIRGQNSRKAEVSTDLSCCRLHHLPYTTYAAGLQPLPKLLFVLLFGLLRQGVLHMHGWVTGGRSESLPLPPCCVCPWGSDRMGLWLGVIPGWPQ